MAGIMVGQFLLPLPQGRQRVACSVVSGLCCSGLGPDRMALLPGMFGGLRGSMVRTQPVK